MPLVLACGAALGAMALVGLAFAGVPMPGVDGDAVVIAVATLFGALLGGLTTFGVERWRLAQDRRERRMLASMVVADALATFQHRLAQRALAARNAHEEPQIFDHRGLFTPDFPLASYHAWVADLPPETARTVFELLAACRDHDQRLDGHKEIQRLAEQAIDVARFAQSLADLFFYTDPIRGACENAVGWSRALVTDHQWQSLSELNRRAAPWPPPHVRPLE